MKLKFLTEERIALTNFFILTDYQDDNMCCVCCNSLVFKDLRLEQEDYVFKCHACHTGHFLNKQFNTDSNIYFIKHISI